MVSGADNDVILIKRIKQGDTQAFRLIVEKYKDVSLTLAYSILRDREDAEDVLQDAFLRLYKSIDKFRFDSRFSTWLYRIVVNTTLNAKEKKKNNLNPGENLEIVCEDKGGYELLIDDERTYFITKALMQVKTEEALLLRLYYLCDLSIREISAVTDLTETNIKVTLHRGRKSMLEALEKITGRDLKSLL